MVQLAYIISLFESPDASDPKRKPIFLLKSNFDKSFKLICLIFLLRNLEDVAIR